jgi:hypothetical protein
MDRKVIAGLLIALLLCIGGCASSGSGQTQSPAPVSTEPVNEIPSDSQIIEDLKTSKTPAGKTVGKQDEDILELKHWKYGAERNEQSAAPKPPQEPIEPQPPTMEEVTYEGWEPVSIQLLSQEEIESIIKQLQESGYLKENSNEADFQNAIRDFQRDNSLPVTGKLDAQTRELLKKK